MRFFLVLLAVLGSSYLYSDQKLVSVSNNGFIGQGAIHRHMLLNQIVQWNLTNTVTHGTGQK